VITRSGLPSDHFAEMLACIDAEPISSDVTECPRCGANIEADIRQLEVGESGIGEAEG
jgi:hypothetical protein